MTLPSFIHPTVKVYAVMGGMLLQLKRSQVRWMG